MSSYAFDNAWHEARGRLARLEGIQDADTCRRLDGLGVRAGWSCLEVGGGGGSVARWLSERVGEAGRVLATDLDPRFLDAIDRPNLEVRRHDIAREELPERGFDLIHARWVLNHIPERDAVLARLVEALRPGGRLLIEEPDEFPPLATAPAPCLAVWEAFRRVIRASGTATDWARDLPGRCEAVGLGDVRVELSVPYFRGGSPQAEFWVLSWRQIGDRMLASGLSARVLDEATELLSRPEHWFAGAATFAVQGVRL